MLVTSHFDKQGVDITLRSQHESIFETQSDISHDSGSPYGTPSDDIPDSPPGNEVQLYYDEIDSIIDKLFEVSTLIRGTPRNFHTDAAAAHVEKDAEGNDALIEFKRMVSLKIKGLCPDTPEWLVNRLVDVISMRRQRFYYQRAQRKLSVRSQGIVPRERTIRVNPTPSECVGENSFPDPPKGPRGRLFECNFCFLVLPDEVRNADLWRLVTSFFALD